VEWCEIYRKIVSSKRALKNVLRDKAIETGDVLLIQDPPIEIEIGDDAIRFTLDGELSAILDENGLTVIDDAVKKEVEYWCVALSSLGFKRYRIRGNRGDFRS